MKITERIHNIETGEITDIEREETAIEKADREKAEAEYIAAIKAKSEAEVKRAALLDKLGITKEEAAVLLG